MVWGIEWCGILGVFVSSFCLAAGGLGVAEVYVLSRWCWSRIGKIVVWIIKAVASISSFLNCVGFVLGVCVCFVVNFELFGR